MVLGSRSGCVIERVGLIYIFVRNLNKHWGNIPCDSISRNSFGLTQGRSTAGKEVLVAMIEQPSLLISWKADMGIARMVYKIVSDLG